MEKYSDYADSLIICANFFDAIGDFESSDEITNVLIKLSEYQNQNIKTAIRFRNPLKDVERAWRRNVLDPIKKALKKVDRWVREKIPGGWVTVIGAVAAAGVIPGFNFNAISKVFSKAGGSVEKLLNGNTTEQMVGKALVNTAEKMATGAVAGGGGDQPGPGPSTPITVPGSGTGLYNTNYMGVSSTYTNEKDKKLSLLKSSLYATNDTSSAQQALNTFRGTLQAYNNTVANNKQLQIGENDLKPIIEEINKSKNYNIR